MNNNSGKSRPWGLIGFFMVGAFCFAYRFYEAIAYQQEVAGAGERCASVALTKAKALFPAPYLTGLRIGRTEVSRTDDEDNTTHSCAMRVVNAKGKTVAHAGALVGPGGDSATVAIVAYK